jgi:hypothetical protein
MVMPLVAGVPALRLLRCCLTRVLFRKRRAGGLGWCAARSRLSSFKPEACRLAPHNFYSPGWARFCAWSSLEKAGPSRVQQF